MSANPSREMPFVTTSETVRSLMTLMDRCALGIALVVDDKKRLEATITDGDVRRAVLTGIELDHSVSHFLAMRKGNLRQRDPIVAPLGTSPEELCRLMTEFGVRQIPLLDEERRVIDIVLDSDYIAAASALPLEGFIMAGGFGKRLMPLTEKCPKSMLPVSGRPIIERLICKLRAAGIQHVSIATHYRAENIIDHFHDGRDFGIHIEYVEEDCPMGTAGALARISHGDLPLLVINGDILTSIDFRAMLEFHREHSPAMTVAVKQHDVQIPFGVITTEGVEAVRIIEKPLVRNLVSAGIYLIQPDVCEMVPQDRPYDMPDLITALLDIHKRVVCFPIHEYWLDVGQLEHYEQAATDTARGLV
jgi:dTDP-glucose pyrophosphorylase/CBS domain-containing protein